ncbi:hypothetical protein ACFYT3_08570 [Nocardia amikacinitolerans]|uniref:hypothetical protein n=1 Tax=Nocardia amikacinitolerans TaxID=756689 RepID=UPI0036B5FAA1
MGTVTVTAKRLLDKAVKRSSRRSTVQLPREFARIQDPTQTETPLSAMFARGEATLKVYLSLVLLTRQPPHDLYGMVTDHFWAEMLGYEELDDADPIPGAGTKRIKRAMTALQKSGPDDETRWITRTREPGRGYKIVVTHLPESRAPWITLPIELWSQGWINVMSARALFVYVILRLILAGKDDAVGAHVSATDRKNHAIKDDTWQRGLKELEALGLARSEIGKSLEDRWSSELLTRKIVYLNKRYLIDNASPLEPVGSKR